MSLHEKAFAKWLASVGYPFDFSFPDNPPPVAIPAIALAWMEKEPGGETLQDWINCIAFETGRTP